jgi:protein-disulfide isomerase
MKPRPCVLVFLLAILLGRVEAALAEPALPAGAMSEKVLGDPEAKIVIIEYASLTCPHCAKFHKETLPQIKAEYIDTGKAKLVYRDFPLDQLALRASLLARCAPDGRFFAFIDALFAEQERWARGTDPVVALTKIGLLGGVGQEQFEACAANEELTNFVLQQRIDAQKEYSVESTPTFIINGEKLVGAQSVAELQAVLDGLLE